MNHVSKIIIIIIIINIKVKRKGKRTEAVRRAWQREFFLFLFLSSLLSQIYGNHTVGFRRSKRQSRSTYRELRVGTKILKFRQPPRGREFSYLCYF